MQRLTSQAGAQPRACPQSSRPRCLAAGPPPRCAERQLAGKRGTVLQQQAWPAAPAAATCVTLHEHLCIHLAGCAHVVIIQESFFPDHSEAHTLPKHHSELQWLKPQPLPAQAMIDHAHVHSFHP